MVKEVGHAKDAGLMDRLSVGMGCTFAVNALGKLLKNSDSRNTNEMRNQKWTSSRVD